MNIFLLILHGKRMPISGATGWGWKRYSKENIWIHYLCPFRAVSYTHLDVYKRQILMNLPGADLEILHLLYEKGIRCV